MSQRGHTQFVPMESDERAQTISDGVSEPNYPNLQEVPVESAIALPAPRFTSEVVIQQTSGERPQTNEIPNFESLELQLKALGTKYYQLQKWGNQGELFRFSCYVTSSEPYQYEKYFQAIGDDGIAAMQAVIADIEKWKNGQ